MEFLKSVLWPTKTAAPARVPTDEILPVHDFDARPQIRDIIMGWTLRFDAVLDADKLGAALAKLLATGDWRKLGGRLRAGKDGQLEMHVPAEFTPSRPAMRFSHDTSHAAAPLSQHALASRLPTRTTTTTKLHADGPAAFEALAAPPGAPRSLAEFLARDAAPLGLHVVSFADATLVSLAFPHVVTDLMGLRALVDNWVRVLRGAAGQGEVDALLGVREDPLAGVGEGEGEEPWALRDEILGGWGRARLALGMLWDRVWLGASSQRMLCLSAGALAALRRRAVVDADANDDWHPQNDNGGGGSGGVYLSDNDILTAWMTRMVAAAPALAPGRTVTLLQFFELRSRLLQLLLNNKRGAYVGNLVFGSWTHVRAGEARRLSLGAVAARLRASLAAQTRAGQVRALVREFRARRARIGAMRADSLVVTCSNWTKGGFFTAVDFGAAVVGGGGGGGGRPVYFHGVTLRPAGWRGWLSGGGQAVGVNILGKDGDGNYWIMGMLPAGSWREVERELAGL